MKLVKLKDVKLGSFILISSTQGYGLSCCKVHSIQDDSINHGITATDMSNNTFVFLYFRYDDYQDTICTVLNDDEVYTILELHKQA